MTKNPTKPKTGAPGTESLLPWQSRLVPWALPASLVSYPLILSDLYSSSTLPPAAQHLIVKCSATNRDMLLATINTVLRYEQPLLRDRKQQECGGGG